MTRSPMQLVGGLPAVLLVLGLSPPIAGAAGAEKPMTQTGGTAGGTAIEILPLPVPASPLVTIRVQFRIGAVDDRPGWEGLNSLTAMTIGHGGTETLTYRELTDRLYPMAATIEVQPDREVTTYIGEVHRDHLEEFYGLLKDLLLTPRFDESDFQRNRDLLLSAIETNLRGNDDEELGKEALNALLYRGHPYGRPDIGTVQGLKSISLRDVRDYYRSHYARDALLIGLAGGYPPGLATRLRNDFAALPASRPPRPAIPRPEAVEGMEVVVVEKPAQATAISIGLPLDVRRGDPDYFPLLLANSFLGEHRTFNGRLMNKMRGERGLNYGDYSYIETFIQDGGSTFPLPNIPRSRQHFSIWIRPVAHENALFALRQALRELRQLVDRGMTEDEVAATTKFLLNYSRLWTQSLSRRLGYEMDALFYGAPSLVPGLQEALPGITARRVNEAVRRNLDRRDLRVAIVTEGAQELVNTLLSGRPTPITYQTPTTSQALLDEDGEIEAFPLPVRRDRIRIVDAQELFER